MRPRPARAGSASSGACVFLLAFLLALGLASAARAQIAPPEVVSRTVLPGAWTAPGPAAEAADRTGKRCMASAARGALRFSTRVGDAWIGEVVDSSASDARNVSLVFADSESPAGEAHVVYYDGSARALREGVRVARPGGRTGWVVYTIDGSADVGSFLSVAFVRNHLGVAYFDATHHALRYAEDVHCHRWATDLVDDEGDVGRFCALAFDAKGAPRISYFDSTSRTVRVAMRSGTRWYITPAVAGAGQQARESSIAVVMPDSVVHVTCRDPASARTWEVALAPPHGAPPPPDAAGRVRR